MSDAPPFRRPPAALVLTPNEEQFADPTLFVESIREEGEKYGIVKIVPPKSWKPRFMIDKKTFTFNPRLQNLSELEGRNRLRYRFLEAFESFWELQGTAITQVPLIQGKSLDFYLLRKVVDDHGGYLPVLKGRLWGNVATELGFDQSSASVLCRHFETWVQPFVLFEKQAKGIPVHASEVPPSMQHVEKTLVAHVIRADCFQTTPAACMKKKKRGRPRATPGSPNTNTSPESSSNESIELPHGGKRPPLGSVDLDLGQESCQICTHGDFAKCLLLCDGCDEAFHTFCLMPPRKTVPKGSWMCTKCTASECSVTTPLEYGFVSSDSDYTFEEFERKADEFERKYASMLTLEEKEENFWRIVTAPFLDAEDPEEVEYGADIASLSAGSGFPTTKKLHPWCSTESKMPQAHHPWNLNNLPINSRSLFRVFQEHVSGVKVPWIYFGMLYTSFCWHIEDHWSYSINYLHYGAPKIWYGVPSTSAQELEKVMISQSKELFEKQPDLLHQLVTLTSPTDLLEHGVEVYRLDQNQGEFVITFPRAYHAGFNSGFNVAEAVNFALPHWLPMARECFQHYKAVKRSPVFAHCEFVLNLADVAQDSCDALQSAYLLQELSVLVKQEQFNATKWSKLKFKLFKFSSLKDEDRECRLCHSTQYLSSIFCPSCETYTCPSHDELCSCVEKKHVYYASRSVEHIQSLFPALERHVKRYHTWIASSPYAALAHHVSSSTKYLDVSEGFEVTDAPKCAATALSIPEPITTTKFHNLIDQQLLRPPSFSSYRDALRFLRDLRERLPKQDDAAFEKWQAQADSEWLFDLRVRFQQHLQSQDVARRNNIYKFFMSERRKDTAISRTRSPGKTAPRTPLTLPLAQFATFLHGIEAAPWSEACEWLLGMAEHFVQQAGFDVKSGIFCKILQVRAPSSDKLSALIEETTDMLDERDFSEEALCVAQVSIAEAIATASRDNQIVLSELQERVSDTLSTLQEWETAAKQLLKSPHIDIQTVRELVSWQPTIQGIPAFNISQLEKEFEHFLDVCKQVLVFDSESDLLQGNFSFVFQAKYSDAKWLLCSCRKSVLAFHPFLSRARDLTEPAEEWIRRLNIIFCKQGAKKKNTKAILKQGLSTCDFAMLHPLRCKNAAKEESEDSTYCTCNSEESDTMVECVICSNWHHNECMSLPDQLPGWYRFCCPSCTAGRRPLFSLCKKMALKGQELLLQVDEYDLLCNLVRKAEDILAQMNAVTDFEQLSKLQAQELCIQADKLEMNLDSEVSAFLTKWETANQLPVSFPNRCVPPAETHCICNGPDDGTSMIQCAKCSRWYHGPCIELTEKEMDAFDSYECRACFSTPQLKKARLIVRD